jgi:phosphoribosylaminoimidazole-succinocarboxamide synthase
MPALYETNFQLPNQTAFYRGKVRDVYTLGDQLVMVASDRISAFDHILPKPIPYKGQVLNQVATHFLRATEDIVPNWLIDTPDPNVASAGPASRSRSRWSSAVTSPDMPGESIKPGREPFAA